jgi:hypothetical protein
MILFLVQKNICGIVPNPIRKKRGFCPTLPSGNQNTRLLGITESKHGIPSHFLAP